MQELRDRIRSPATEYKATHVLRSKHRAVLEWLLGPEPAARPGPGVPDRQDLLRAGKVTDLLVAGRTDVGLRLSLDTRAITDTLYREGPRTFTQWPRFLLAANEAHAPAVGGRPLLRAHRGAVRRLPRRPAPGRPGPTPSGSRARRGVPGPGARRWPAAAGPAGPGHPAGRAHLGGGSTPVTIVHDRQNTLPAGRIAALTSLLEGRLAGVTLVNSFTTPTVQVADMLAGAVRKLVEDELRGEADPTTHRATRTVR